MRHTIYMKYLGIDFGGKRIGLAVSDEENAFAFPLSVVQNNSGVLEEIIAVVTKEEVEKVIIGDSKNLDMKNNPIMKDVERFIKGWKEKTQIPIELYTEMFTSQAAARFAPKDDLHDARAAALILQGYIDRR